MTTTPTASPELLDLDKLEALARAATAGPWLHRRDPGNPIGAQHCVKLAGENGAWVCDCIDNADRSTVGGIAGERNAAFIASTHPDAVLALIALARRVQPYATGGTVPGGLHLVGEAPQATCTVPPEGWHCTRALGHDGPCAAWPIAQQAAAPGAVHITPQEAAAAGIECGDTECGGCNADEPWCIHSAPGALPGRIICATPGMNIIEVKIDHGFLPEWLDPGYQVHVSSTAPSAPGTPEAPKKPAHGHRDDYHLLANGRRLGLESISRVRNMPNWVLAMELFATGSTSAHQICQDAGIDPDSTTIQRAAAPKGGM